MNYSTYVNLTNYATPALALAAKPTNGQAWLLNEPQVFQDARMPKAGPASVKNNQQTQKAKTLNTTINRNKISTGVYSNANRSKGNKTAGYANTSKGGGSLVNIENKANAKAPAIRNMVTWHVTDDTQPGGYRRVTGVLQDPTTTSPYRDDDNQVRI